MNFISHVVCFIKPSNLYKHGRIVLKINWRTSNYTFERFHRRRFVSVFPSPSVSARNVLSETCTSLDSWYGLLYWWWQKVVNIEHVLQTHFGLCFSSVLNRSEENRFKRCWAQLLLFAVRSRKLAASQLPLIKYWVERSCFCGFWNWQCSFGSFKTLYAQHMWWSGTCWHRQNYMDCWFAMIYQLILRKLFVRSLEWSFCTQ